MLVLTRKPREALVLFATVEGLENLLREAQESPSGTTTLANVSPVEVLFARGRWRSFGTVLGVRMGVEAPSDVHVLRQEALKRSGV